MTDAGPRTAAQAANLGEPGAGDFLREQRLQRNLKMLVGFLGFLILAGLAAVAVRIVSSSSNRPPALPSTPTAAGTPGANVALELPPGAKIVSVSVAGNRLAVHHESPSGAGIVVLDLDNGRRIMTVTPVESPPATP